MGSSFSAILIALAIIVPGQQPDSQENSTLPKPDDILAGFRANYDSLSTLRVLWSRETGYDPSWFIYLEWLIQDTKKLIDSPDSTTAEKAEALGLSQNYQQMLDNPKAREKTVFLSEFLTDRSNSQVRVFPQNTSAQLPAGYTFSPRIESRPETLLTIFKDCQIFNHSVSPRVENRMWFGIQKGKFFKAETTEQRIQNAKIYFPPLGINTIEWSDGWTDLDEFFARPPNEMKVLRQEVLDDHKVYLMEHVRERNLGKEAVSKNLATKYPGKVGMVDVTRVWVDPQRGFLPLRYEKGAVYTYEGKRVGPPKFDYYLAMTVTDLRQIQNGGWYPMEGKIENVQLDPEWTKKGFNPYDLEKILGGTAENAPLKPYSTISWKVVKILVGEDLSSCFNLEFPTGTEYFEGKDRAARFVGNLQDYLDHARSGATDTQFAPRDIGVGGSRAKWILIALNVTVLVIVGVVVHSRYRRRKAGEAQ